MVAVRAVHGSIPLLTQYGRSLFGNAQVGMFWVDSAGRLAVLEVPAFAGMTIEGGCSAGGDALANGGLCAHGLEARATREDMWRGVAGSPRSSAAPREAK